MNVVFSLRVVGLLGLVAVVASPLGWAQTPPPTTLPPVTVGRMTVAWSGANGLSVAVDGVPTVRKSTLYLVKRGWSGVLLDQSSAPPVVTPWANGTNGTQTATISLDTPDAACVYQLTAAPSEVTVDLAYRLKRDIPAEIEYGAAYLSAPVLEGAALTGGSGKAQTVSVTPPAAGRTQEQNRLATSFSLLRFATRRGLFSVAFSGDAPRPLLFDARSDDEGWAREFPTFWLGIGSPEQPVTFKDGVRHATFRFRVGEAASGGGIAPALTLAGNATPTRPDTYAPTLPAAPLILPRPKEMRMETDARAFRPNAQTRLVVRDGATPDDRRGASLVQTEIQTRFGFAPAIVEARLAGDFANVVVFGEPGNATGKAKALLAGLPPAHPEGYTVAVSPQTVVVAGNDPAGTLWGAQTLIQLLAADTTGPLVRPAAIHDWPTLSVRGVHLFYGQNALPFQEKLIDRVLTRFKMNALFMQAEQVRWDTDPAVAPSWAGRKADIKTEIAYAHDRGMTLYPLLQSYGHMEWLFNKPANRAFAEDPETPYAVNLTNPDAVQYLEKFNAEADDLFAAPAFHVGMDEVTMRGRFPYQSKGRTFADLYVSGAKHWHDFFAARGKQMWMWADMALFADDVRPTFGTAPSAADAAAVRKGLPKDIVMVDWQYGALDRFPSLQRLKDAGFTKLVGATWFNPGNIQNFSRALAQIGGLGAIQTTWAGYESSEAVLSTPNRKQFTAMVLAADYFWNGGAGPAPDKLPYDWNEVFARQWQDIRPAAQHVRPGYALDLSPLAGRPTSDWLGLGDGPALPTGETRLADGVQYRLGTQTLLLAGKLNPAPAPTTVTLPLPAPAREVSLVLAASHPATPGTRVGTVTVTTGDGQSVVVDLIYGKNIAALTDGQTLPDAPALWRGKTTGGQTALLRGLTWTGRGGERATRVTITSFNTESAPAVFAVSALTQ